MPSIELIGSIDKSIHYKTEYIETLLSSNRQALNIGTSFTGRPDTRIHVNNHDIVKIRAELQLSEKKAHLWANDILHKEQDLLIHHPHKTWFISNNHITSSILVGNVCPRLRPLHIELKPTPTSELERTRYLTILQSVFKLYFQLAKEKELKLDEGLSNFAIDKTDTLYYLDDEYYTWDNFIAFSAMFGVFIRTFTWLDIDFMRHLTDILVTLVDDIFQDPHYRVIISSQLQPLFMAAGLKEELLAETIKGFSKKPISTTKTSNPQRTKKYTNNRYLAIMADIHANEAALDTVLAFYKEQHIDQGIVLGDIVGYGPDPKVCIEKLQDSPFEIIKGNHDHATAIAEVKKGYSKDAETVINWTIGQLDNSHLEWLKYLPSFLQHKDWFAVHGAPMDPAFFYGYVYSMTAEDNLDYMQKKNISLCFHGHSHMQGVYARDHFFADHHLSDQKVKQSKYQALLVCPGSVGQPRNGKPHAQCAIYDRVDKKINFFSLPYPVDSVVQRMKDYNLPKPLWQRLLRGM